MCRKITRQSRWNLRRASDRAIPNQALGMVREGVETGWRAPLVGEGTVRLSSKGESDRITKGRWSNPPLRFHQRMLFVLYPSPCAANVPRTLTKPRVSSAYNLK